MRRYLIALLVFVAGFIAWTSSLKDFEITWHRDVPSLHTPEELGAALDDLETWPVFHHSLKSATLEDGVVKYEIEPLKKEWKRFEMIGKVTERVPGKKLSIELESDSTGRLTRLFDAYRWTVEIEAAPPELQARGQKSVIRGTAVAHTANWRGRLFGKVSPRILMNQVFYVDLVKFGTLARQVEAKKENLAPSFQ